MKTGSGTCIVILLKENQEKDKTKKGCFII